MSKPIQPQTILNRAKDINKKDVKTYLDLREDLSLNITKIFQKIQCHALNMDYDGKSVSKEEVQTCKDLLKFYMSELKDDGALREIQKEAEAKIAAASDKKKRSNVNIPEEQDIPELGQVVSFSKSAE